MNTTRYFRKALASQISPRIDFRNDCFCAVTMGEVANGELPSSVYNKLLEKSTKQSDNTKRDIEVLIAAKTVRIHFDEGTRVKGTDDLTCVFFAPAILHEDGSLSHNEDKFPWFVREFLEPMVEPELSLGKAESVDAFLSANVDRWYEIKKWEEYWQYVCAMYRTVTGTQITETSLPNAPQITFEDDSIIIRDKTVSASQNILKLYDEILGAGDTTKQPPLYRNLMSGLEMPSRPIVEETPETMRAHCGQMGCAYPLSESQRNSLNHLNLLREGEVLAVSGPPGTGKTTLLQSVVADLVTKHALEQKDAPIIVASSTNNQAVTNIIDSFSGLEAGDDTDLACRWITAADSLATYFPSSSRKAQAKEKGYLIDEEMVRQLNQKAAHEASTEKMLNECGRFFQQSVESIDACRVLIHEELVKNEDIKCSLLEKHSATMSLTNHVSVQQYSSQIASELSALKQEAEQLELFIQKQYGERQSLYLRMEEWQSSYKEQIPWHVRLLSFVPAFSNRIICWTLGFKSEREIVAAPVAQTLKEVLAFYHEQILKTDAEIHSLTEKAYALKLQIQHLEDCAEKVELALRETIAVGDMMKDQRAYRLPKETDFRKFLENATMNTLNEYLDVSLRWRSFWLAVHYYECMWLEEGAIEEDNLWKTTFPMLDKKYRQLANLTPCFVMTFYMLPAKFKTYRDSFLMNYIDLLIVDEAGQTSPEVAAASFTLAKRAIVVGDEYQIPPVWGVSQALDMAIAMECGVIQQEEEFSLLEKCGLNTSQSSVMKLAYGACPYNVHKKGLFLSEHRRCYNEIIGYCNDLVYQNRLRPLRGWGQEDPKRPALLKEYPIIGCHDIPVTASEKTGSSRKNTAEAKAIAQWIHHHFDTLCSAYPDENKENILAVITPFKAQVREIESQLREVLPSEQSIQVGTVHTFQGAEKKIIIFSTTYGASESGFFIENNSNLMNVAVSRARDAFWVFGSIDCLRNGSATSAKGLLYQYVQKNRF